VARFLGDVDGFFLIDLEGLADRRLVDILAFNVSDTS
jgi:hypothetical protein